MTTYTKADPKQLAALERALAKYHQRLIDAGVKVDLSVAFAKVNEETGEIMGPALKLRGAAILAKVKILSLEDRVQGHGDARITIDGDRWADLTPDERMALLDHELTHLLVVEEMVRNSPPKPGDGPVPVAPVAFKPKLDDHGRPKLRMRPHDVEITGIFIEVLDRHKGASQEHQQVQRYMHPGNDAPLRRLGRRDRQRAHHQRTDPGWVFPSAWRAARTPDVVETYRTRPD